MIDSFTGPYGFLSNFSLHPVELPWLGGLKFATAEHAFQACKGSEMSDVMRITACATPGEAKRAGRTIRLRPDWDQVKRRVMAEVLLAKFGDDDDLAKMLAATAPHVLVEGNHWGDSYWGAIPADHAMIRPPGSGMPPVWHDGPAQQVASRIWCGDNWLGRILVMTRELVTP